MGSESLVAALAEATTEAPVRVGRYEVTGVIGRGGMGTVYHAVDREHDAPVALKTLRHMDAANLLRFKNEFRSVADLSHPNLVPVYELACHDDLWFFTMAYVDGVNIIEWLRGGPVEQAATGSPTVAASPRGVRAKSERQAAGTAGEVASPTPRMPPSIDRVRDALAQLIAGVHALHQADLLHLDIKPSNVLVDAAGVVHVLDFGLIRPVDEERTTVPSEGAVSIFGTPMWMAPEQFVNAAIGKATDWYAVGLMLYMGLTGVPAFPEASTADMAHTRQLVAPAPPRTLVPDLPNDLSELATALLQSDAAARPSGETLRELTAAGDDDTRVRQMPFVGRRTELSALRSAYRRVAEGGAVLAQVTGSSGLGKTALLGQLLREARRSDALALRARCYERESVPYKGFDGLLDQLAAALATRTGDSLTPALPRWIRELVRVFPVLDTVPAIRTHLEQIPDTAESMSVVELRRRAVEALRELFSNLAQDRPLLLEIDDLQWADADSISLLLRLMFPLPPRMLIVVSFRPAEAHANPIIIPYLTAVESMSSSMLNIALQPLPDADAQKLATLTLSTLDAPTDAAPAIAAESGGVPFFIEELAHYVAQQAPGETVADGISLDAVLTHRVRTLPPEQRALVEVLSVANNPIPLPVAFEQAQLGDEALRALWGLRSRHLVRTTGASAYDLVELHHDRLRESVVSYLPTERIDDIHLELGRALAREGVASSWRFDAVRHLNCVHPRLEGSERSRAAWLNLEAGIVARRGAAFPLAFDCFRAGVALLSETAWDDEYELALELYGGAAESAYLCSAWNHIDVYVDAIKTHARTPLDQLVAWETQIDACIGKNDYVGAITAAVEVLTLLGEALPADPGEAEVGAAVQAAMAALADISPEAFASLPVVQDPSVAAAMRLQSRITSAAYFGRPMLLPVIACRLVVTSVERGISPVTPYALSVFGIVLNTLGMHPEAHSWGKVALGLLDRFDDRSQEARTRHVSNNLVCTWMVPLESTLDAMREVVAIGKATGDVEYAAYAAHAYVHNALYAGRALDPLYEVALEYGEFMRGHQQINALHVHEPFEQMLRCFLGLVDDPARLDGHGFTEAAALEAATASGSRAAQCLIRCVMGMVRFHFGTAADAVQVFEEARPFLDGMPSVWHTPMFHQYAAMAIHGLPTDARSAMRDKADHSLAELRRLAGHSPANFAHRVALVEAEQLRADGALEQARTCYERAIELAQTHRWPNDVALAHELAARATGDEAHARAAHDAYARWGATAKLTR